MARLNGAVWPCIVLVFTVLMGGRLQKLGDVIYRSDIFPVISQQSVLLNRSTKLGTDLC